MSLSFQMEKLHRENWLNSMVRLWLITSRNGAENQSFIPIVKDEPEEIKSAFLKPWISPTSLLLMLALLRVRRIITVHIIEELGEVYTHGVATRPGKPVILGKIKTRFVIGVPGYPVSAYLDLNGLSAASLRLLANSSTKAANDNGEARASDCRDDGSRGFYPHEYRLCEWRVCCESASKSGRCDDVTCESRWDAVNSVPFTWL